MKPFVRRVDIEPENGRRVQVKERPILFTAPMVRALLDGLKLQTRRIVKPQPFTNNVRGPELYQPTTIDRHGEEQPGDYIYGIYDDSGEWGVKSPYGQTGDWLWVKETHQAHPIYGSPVYRADWPTDNNPVRNEGWPWRPSIFMPRRLSRITLEITGVRVERLQDISRGDAMDEGCPFSNLAGGVNPRDWYAELWESINGPGSWAANPWVWVIEFTKNS